VPGKAECLVLDSKLRHGQTTKALWPLLPAQLPPHVHTLEEELIHWELVGSLARTKALWGGSASDVCWDPLGAI
jgi:hypothetical protein